MATWAGVQKVSRPIERCQEMSQYPPMMLELTAIRRSNDTRTPHGPLPPTASLS